MAHKRLTANDLLGMELRANLEYPMHPLALDVRMLIRECCSLYNYAPDDLPNGQEDELAYRAWAEAKKRLGIYPPA